MHGRNMYTKDSSDVERANNQLHVTWLATHALTQITILVQCYYS